MGEGFGLLGCKAEGLDLFRLFVKIDPMSATGKKASLFKDSKGTKMAAKTRQHANQLSDEERQQALAVALSVIYIKG